MVRPVATVLMLRGSLSVGTHLICGTTQAKVRLLTSPSGKQVDIVHPGEAAVVSGWKELPGAGDEVLSGTEADIKKALANRIRKAEIEATLQDVDAINISRREERERREEELQAKRDPRAQRSGASGPAQTKDDGNKVLKVLVKGDVSGSVEAVAGALQGIGNHLVSVKIVATGVGEVTESDVMHAKATEGAYQVSIAQNPQLCLIDRNPYRHDRCVLGQSAQSNRIPCERTRRSDPFVFRHLSPHGQHQGGSH